MASGLEMERAKLYKGKVTSCVVIASVIASFGGFLFGYASILGQLMVQYIFYDMFLWDSYKKSPRSYDYCKYSSRFNFPLYVGPLYLAGALASLLAYPLPRKYGRRMSIIVAEVISFIGAAAGVYPVNLVLALINQIMLGFGIGFGNQVILLYLSEIAQPRFRGALSTMFHLAISLGMLTGNLLKSNLRDESTKEWLIYFAMGFPVIPPVFMVIGGLKFLPETPNSLVERGFIEKGREALAKIRGTEDVDAEFEDIVEASAFANSTTRNHFHAMKNIFQMRNRPQLVMAIAISLFHNLTGIIFVLSYGRLLFMSLGSKHSSLYSAAIYGGILVASTLLSMTTVDKLGRRVLLISGGVLMIISQVAIAIMLGSNLFNDQLGTNGLSILLIIMIGIFVLAYGWSWGPLGWTIPSEIFTLETRSVGQGIAVSINLLFAYLVLQFFVPLLCVFKYGLFLFFACWIVAMTVFVYLFLPETKGVPIEEMGLLWTKHWFWKKIVVVGEDSEVLHEVQLQNMSENASLIKHSSYVYL